MPGTYPRHAPRPLSRSSETQGSHKRKVTGSEPASAASPVAAFSPDHSSPPQKRATGRIRAGLSSSVTVSENGRATRSQTAAQPERSQSDVGIRIITGEDESEHHAEAQVIAENVAPDRDHHAVRGKARMVPEMPVALTTVLPAGKVFPIQIGSELFRLSGASLSSDGKDGESV